jgi:hypothetical protein
VRFVDDDRIVAPQQRIRPELCQEKTVGQQHQPGGVGDLVGKPHPESHRGADRLRQLLGDARGQRARRQPARLRVRDLAVDPAAHLQTVLR